MRITPTLRLAGVLALLLAGCGSTAISTDGGADASRPTLDTAPPLDLETPLDTGAPLDTGTPLEAAAQDAPVADAAPEAPPDVSKSDVACPYYQPIPPFCVEYRPLTNPCLLPLTGPVICVDGRWVCPAGSTFAVEGCPPPDAATAPNPG